MHDHNTRKYSHVFKHNNILGHKIEFENVNILYRSGNVLKLSYININKKA